MDIFLRDVPYAANDTDIVVALAQILHRAPFPRDSPTNFHVELFPQHRSNNHRGMGILTLPTVPIGDLFLRLYAGRGIYMKGRTIQFSRSTKPLSRGVLERLLSSTWEDPSVLKMEQERKALESKPITLAAVSFGHFCRDGSFGVENTPPGSGQIACDLNLRQVKLTMSPALANIFSVTFHPNTSATYRPSQIKKVIASGVSSSSPANVQPLIFLESSTPPRFEQVAQANSVRRCSSLQGDSTMTPGCTILCLTFRSDSDLNIFHKRCKELGLPSMQKRDIVVCRRSAFSNDNMEQLSDFLKSLEFSLAFQIQKAVMESLLEPLEVISLENDIFKLQDKYGTQAYTFFQYFAETLRGSRRELRSRHRRRDAMRVAMTASYAQQRLPTLSQQLDEAVDAYSKLQNQLRPFSFTSPAFYLSYHIIITPSSQILEGPLPDQSNSVLRRFGNHDCFLRVTFSDENRSGLRRDAALSISELLESRCGSLLKSGFQLAGRTYEFLGYSMSGLKHHSVWFVTPFAFEGRDMDAAGIRGSLGDFTRIMYEPARLAARWSQAFSGTDPTIVLDPNEIGQIPDRESANGSVFTDGCGTISNELARIAWSTLRSQKGHITGSKSVPSCFQIRLGGAKGVVVVDPTLTGRSIFLRPSQTKFDARDVRTLDIQSCSSRPRPMFLNRPMIVIMEYLGVKNEVFTNLQDMAVHDIRSGSNSFLEASKLFGQHGLGASFRLPSLMTNIKTQLGLDIKSYSAPDGLHHHLINETIRCACAQALREIKHRAHIPVEGSVTLLGVSDEWGCLREGEIYATVFDERTGISQPIEGRVLVTRSPQIHPGDLQYATAVRRPELDHLNNVMVFSCEGKRSLPSCLSGGDLDGDDYNLILDPALHPPAITRPANYTCVPNKRTPLPCTIADIAGFITDYIESDLIGYIAILQLRYADLKDPGCKEYLDLAKFASHAVDYPKTGVPVKFTDLPHPPQSERPDFLSGESSNRRLTDRFYRSGKILGVLFRRVLIDDDMPAYHHGNLEPSDGAKIWKYLQNVNDFPDLGLSPFKPPPEDLREEMEYLLEAYADQLFIIAQTHTLSKHADSFLSEGELVSGTILASWADHSKRSEAVLAMNLQTQQLTKAIRSEFVRDADSKTMNSGWDSDDTDNEEEDEKVKVKTIKRAWAAWNVAEDALAEDPESFGPSSFGIIAMGTILELIKKLRTAY